MNPFQVNFGPGQDKFIDLYQSFNNAIDEIINGASLSGTLLRLHRYAGPDITVDLASLPADSYSIINTSAPTYTLPTSVGNALIRADSSSNVVNINLPSPTQPRMIGVVDTTGSAATNTISIASPPLAWGHVLESSFQGVWLMAGGTTWQVVAEYHDTSNFGAYSTSYFNSPGSHVIPAALPKQAGRIIIYNPSVSGTLSLTLPTTAPNGYFVMVKRIAAPPAANTITINTTSPHVIDNVTSVNVATAGPNSGVIIQRVVAGPYDGWIIAGQTP